MTDAEGKFLNALWDAINTYAMTCGGDPSGHVYGNTPRMNAVAAVDSVVRTALRAAEERADAAIDDRVKAALELGEARRARDAALARAERAESLLTRTSHGGTIVSSNALTPEQIAIARAADRMLVTPDGYGYVYVPGPSLVPAESLSAALARAEAAEKERDQAVAGAERAETFGLLAVVECGKLLAKSPRDQMLQIGLFSERADAAFAEFEAVRARADSLAREVAALLAHFRCEQCSEPATRYLSTEGDGCFWFCDREDGDHGTEFYCWERVMIDLHPIRAALAKEGADA